MANDGKIVVAGNAPPRLLGGLPDQDFAVVRYNADGTLDPAFGSGGKVTTQISSGADGGTAVAIQADGRILVAGYAKDDVVLVRYNTDGSLDTTFGGKNKGRILTGISRNSIDGARDLALQADGKIVVAGWTLSQSGAHGIALVRYNTDGSLDKSFDGDGKATLFFAAAKVSDDPSSMETAMDPTTGKFVVASRSDNQDGTSVIAVARFNTTGSLDTTFGNGTGSVVFDASTWSSAALAVQADGKVLVTFATIGSDIRIVRLATDGNLDSTFGTSGMVTTLLPTFEAPSSIAILADGKIVVGGVQGVDFFLARYNIDGSLDDGSASDSTPFDSFGVNGAGVTSGLAVDWHYGMDLVVRSDSRFVLAGTREVEGANGSTLDLEWALAAFQGDAALTAAASATQPVQQTLTVKQVEPLLAVALARWQAADVDTSAFDSIDIRIADLGGMTLGLASGHTIWLDAGHPRSGSVAGWSWFVDANPWEDSEFTTPSDQGEQGRMDLLTVVMHELGHMLALEHDDGLMQETLSAGERLMRHGVEIDEFWRLVGLSDLTMKRDAFAWWL